LRRRQRCLTCPCAFIHTLHNKHQTGAGKTAIAEAAAAAVLAAGKRVVYTTPLKALSNQKLLEVRARFGGRRCGLQTGDTSLNTDAEVVVMTTEILRNIMYRTAETTGGVGERREKLSLWLLCVSL
jgi:superfamily II RNA helicase